jgi:Tol biopolymer transport system component
MTRATLVSRALVAPSTQADYSPSFSPDGQKIAFVSDRSGAADIWVSPVNGGEPRKLTSLQPGEIPMWPSWSPDGTRITFFSRRTGVNYAYETDVASGSTRPLKLGDDYALFPQYSADGKRSTMCPKRDTASGSGGSRSPRTRMPSHWPPPKYAFFAYLRTGAFSTSFNPVTLLG